jgi:hypothetical protein
MRPAAGFSLEIRLAMFMAEAAPLDAAERGTPTVLSRLQEVFL